MTKIENNLVDNKQKKFNAINISVNLIKILKCYFKCVKNLHKKNKNSWKMNKT